MSSKDELYGNIKAKSVTNQRQPLRNDNSYPLAPIYARFINNCACWLSALYDYLSIQFFSQ